jgi:hypothetical protein
MAALFSLKNSKYLIIKTAINVSSNCAGFERGRILTK